MSTTHYEGNYELFDINLALAGGITVIAPMLPVIDATLFGAFGLGPMALDFQAQLDAALSVSIIPPNVWITGQLKAMADIVAGISAGAILPTIAISANASLAAALTAKLIGVNLAIDAMLDVQLPAATLLGELRAAASAQVGYLVWQGTPAEVDSEVGAKLKVLAIGNDGAPGADVYIIALVFGSQAAFNAAATMFLTSP